MKTIRRISSLLFSLIMVLSIATTAFAAEGNYTITAPDNGHTYEVYQIFTGKLSEGVLSDIQWGRNGTGYKEGQTTYVDGTVTNALSALTGSDAEKLAGITPYVDLNTAAFATIASGASKEVPSGYYLIKDVDGSQDNNSAYTLYLVKVVGDTTITPKTSIPTVEKKVYEEEKGWQDAADYDIGDSIDYKLTATLGDISMYKTYYVQFDDILSKGITYNTGDKAAKVYVVNGDSEKEVTDSFTITTGTYSGDKAAYEGGSTLLATCNDIKAIEGVTLQTGTKIVVKYSVTLNQNAKIGATGNPNEVKLIYSNNPNENHGGEHGTTPEDKVTVFTYKLVADKVDGNGKALKGAGFTLYKQTGTQQVDTETNPIWTAVGTEVSGTDMTTFTWTGLDSGTYKLEETTKPEGYNKAEDLLFTITATYDIESQDPRLTALTVDKDTVTVKDDLSEIDTTVVNYTGATLPSSGGIGTTRFYILGAMLFLSASVLLITKKRMGVRNE